MASEIDREQRLTRLETRMEGMAEDVSNIAKDLRQLNELLLQAKGPRWAILGMAGAAGFLSSHIPSIFKITGHN